MHLEVFETNDGRWFWHLKSKGRVVAQGEEHISRGHTIRAAKGVVTAVCKPAKVCDYKPEFKTTVKDGITTITWG